MLNIVKGSTGRDIPENQAQLDVEYAYALKRLISRFKKKRVSARKLSKKLGLTAPTLLSLFENPKRRVSRSTKIKIFRSANPARKKHKKIFQAVVGWPNRCAI